MHLHQADSGTTLTTTDLLDQRSPDEVIAARLKRYRVRLAIGFIIGGNALFLLGLWASGLDLDKVFAERDFFDPVRDVCLRLAWYMPVGEKDPVRLCKEWITLSDTSGQVHKVQNDMKIVKGSDGKVYASSVPADGRVIVVIFLVVAIVGGGMWLQRYLIARYRARLMADRKTP